MQLKNSKDAIQQAIEGGYGERKGIPPLLSFEGKLVFFGGGSISVLQALTDPLFWQALGKVRGWKIYRELSVGTKNPVTFTNDSDWQKYAIEWFMNRLSNGDEQKYWESLP